MDIDFPSMTGGESHSLLATHYSPLPPCLTSSQIERKLSVAEGSSGW